MTHCVASLRKWVCRASHQRLIALVVAIVLGFVVGGIGSLSWGVLIVANVSTTPAIPWAVAAMAVVLWAYWRFFGGWGPPRRFSAARKDLLRARQVPRRPLAWSLIAGISSIIGLAGFWILLVRLGMPGGNPTESAMSGYPAVTVGLFIIMGSLVSPITEETAFRGYAQATLERAYPPMVAVGVSSFLFMLWHGPTQGFIAGKLLVFFLVGVVFGTIAYINKSTIPALPVHIMGDLLFFTLIWPEDATRALIVNTGLDGIFWLTLAGILVAVIVAALAFFRLHGARNETKP